jgi:serine-type D-Ala-D-Ala carboxypeptidase/endopeptidase (penicillin-binding protein 4)
MNLKILTLILLIPTGLCAQLENKVDALAKESAMAPGQLSFKALDLSTGETLVSFDSGKRIRPASTLKVLTCYAAMDVLGPDHVFLTRVGASGRVNAEGVLIGDLIIEAGGDPALGSENFKEAYGAAPLISQVAMALRQAGVKTIQGSICIDESIYEGPDIPEDWTWQDMGNYYAAGAHAFSYQENMFTVELQSGPQAGSLTALRKVSPELPGVYMVNEVRAATISGDEAYFYSAPQMTVMTIRGEIPLSQKAFTVKGAMPHPAAVFKAQLESSLEKMGIICLGVSTDEKVAKDAEGSIMVEEYLRWESPRLEELIAHTLLTSDNLYAEHFTRHIALALGANGSLSEGVDAITAWAQEKGMDISAIQIKDGSGLSRSNAVTADFMVDLLSHLTVESYFPEFSLGLSIAGRTGGMKRIGKGTSIEGRLIGKSGYIEGARGYVGYDVKNGNYIAYCLLAEDYVMSPSVMRERLEDILIEMGR